MTDIDTFLERKQAAQQQAAQSASLRARLVALRAWQAARLAATYRDLLADARHGPALRFFLSELYGSEDFTLRDRDIGRVWRHLRRALPRSALTVLARALELDALSAELDLAVARQLGPEPITLERYARAYGAAGRADARRAQIGLVCSIGADLDRLVRQRLIGAALRLAHAPAIAAGFGTLQGFLERGYAAFRGLQGAGTLLQLIEERETQFMQQMLAYSSTERAPDVAQG